jgi:hypothetical protein
MSASLKAFLTLWPSLSASASACHSLATCSFVRQ